jgi:hypothetical protein
MQSLLAKARVTVCDEEEDQSHFEEEEEVFYLFRPDNTSAGSNDPASYHQFATIMFVCGHPRHNAQGIIGHINPNIIMLIKFMIA